MSEAGSYVRICPVCGTEHLPAASQCGCGTLLIGVDLTLRAPTPTAPAVASAEVPAAPAAGSLCPHADCGATNPPGQDECLYCGRPLGSAAGIVAKTTPAAPAAGLYNLPAALAVNFAIDRVLPAGGAEAELMLLKGLKTGVRVMAKLYRPGIAPKGEVLERVAKVAHAHVVRLLAHGVSDGVAYEVMEYCAAGSLRDLMRQGRPTPEQVRAILGEIAKAVAALHACQVIHRDLKPENVLVRRTEPLDLVLTDFGIASLQDATQLFTGTARTARYAPPEAMSGVLDAAADYWSLGMILVELLTGEHPFAGLSDPVVAHRLATGNIDTETLVDPAWRRLCRGLLQRDPKLRWGIVEIRRWLAGDPSLPEPALSATPLAHAYRIEGEECRTLPELAAAFSRHWEAARKDLARGQFETWVRQDLKDHDLTRFLHDLKERGGSADLQLFRLIGHLAPAIPPGWRGAGLTVEAILAKAAMATNSAQGVDTAADWLASLYDERVLEMLPTEAFPAEVALAALWRNAWRDFGTAWREADEALGRWRHELVTSGEAVVDVDALMYGRGGGLDRPAEGLIHGPLLLALQHPEYLTGLRTKVLAEAAGHLEHSPWLAALCDQAAADDAKGTATLVAVMHLLPQARQAGEEGQQRIASRRVRQTDELDRLAQRINESLASLRGGAEELGLVFAEASHHRLAGQLREFFALSLEARGQIPNCNPALQVVARAEPLVSRMRDRLDEWESTRRINEVWANEHLRNTAIGAIVLLFMFAPQWLPLVLAPPILFTGWRLWIAVRHRSAIRQLATGLPLRVTGTSPS